MAFALASCITAMLPGCYYDKGDKLYPGTIQCDTSNVTYSGVVRPIITVNCLNQGCHTTANPSGGFNFESHAAFIATIPNNRLLNAINYRSGGSKNMPPTGKLSDCDIRKIEAWVGKGAPEN